MKYQCCNCKKIFSDDESHNKPSDGDLSCPDCRVNLKKCSPKASNIKGMNFIVATFVLGVVGNSVGGEVFHEATGISLLVVSFGLFVLSIIVVILLNIKKKESLINETELMDQMDEIDH